MITGILRKASAIAIVGSVGLLMSCGGGARTTTTTTVQPSNYNPTDEAKINCVARDGFLVPVKGGFVCRLPDGQRVSLANL